jgi:hypothetical protein
MRNRVLAAALFAVLFCGCPPGQWFGRHVIVNNTDSVVTDLTISVGDGSDKTWVQTSPGQGWIDSKPPRHTSLIVCWKDESGYHEKRLDFRKKISYQSKDDLYIELKPHGLLEWRMIKESAETASVWALTPIYVSWCLFIGLLIGVPLALAAVVAYVLFKFIRAGLIATVKGLHGDNTAFQFTIREIALLTVTVGLIVGWWANRNQLLWTIENEHRHNVGAVRSNLKLTREIQKLNPNFSPDNLTE